MFDQPPPNLPTGPEPEDIFSKTADAPSSAPPPSQTVAAPPPPPPPPPAAPQGAGTPVEFPQALDAGKLRPVAPQVPVDEQVIVEKPFLSKGKIVTVLVAAVVVVGFGAAGAWFATRNRGGALDASPAATTPPASAPESEPAPPTPAPIPEPEAEPTPPPEPVDTDGDGFEDSRELELGTDPQNPDTDGDGLTDKEETTIWKTNPLNADSDGDTYPDGHEVKNGYSPSGPGKLFEVPAQ